MKGNPLAVVIDGDGLTDSEMQQFANWTNLSETTFLFPPQHPGADYQVRIFTTSRELPFAGHPTLGSCAVWLGHGGVPAVEGQVVQECGIGLVTLSVTGDRSAFAAPPLIRSGPVEHDMVASLAKALRIDETEIVDSQWIDNGPGWVGLLLADAASVLAVEPDPGAMFDLKIGIAGLATGGAGHALEVRAFFSDGASFAEDPVTGSLNASLAQWLLGNATLTSPYIAHQGTALGRAGQVHVHEADGEVWIGGDVVTCIRGSVDI